MDESGGSNAIHGVNSFFVCRPSKQASLTSALCLFARLARHLAGAAVARMLWGIAPMRLGSASLLAPVSNCGDRHDSCAR